MSIKVKVIFLGFLCASNFFAVSFAENTSKIESGFIVKKSEKKIGTKVSKSKMQEDLCEVFGNQISFIPDVNQKVAQVQKILLDHTCKYLESASDCIILKSDKKKMDEMLRVAKDFEIKMQEFSHDCDKYLEYLKSIK